MCWFTFWGGLLFFLGHENKDNVRDEVLIFTTLALVTANCTFLIYSAFAFVREYFRDRKKANARRELRRSNVANGLHQIMPTITNESNGEGEGEVTKTPSPSTSNRSNP